MVAYKTFMYERRREKGKENLREEILKWPCAALILFALEGPLAPERAPKVQIGARREELQLHLSSLFLLLYSLPADRSHQAGSIVGSEDLEQ